MIKSSSLIIPPASGTLSNPAPAPPSAIDEQFTRQQAQQLWQELDQMAINQPEQYRQFIQQQLKDYQQSASTAPSTSATPPATPLIRPGFSVKCKTLNSTTENHYINFCQSQRIDRPDPTALRPQTATGTIPMMVDDPRERRDKSGQAYIVYDLICHPSVVDMATKNDQFQQKLIQLAQYSISTTFPPVKFKKGNVVFLYYLFT
jgi:hypothetical protein